MSTNAAWKCLSVEEFVGKCNWKNLAPKVLKNSPVVQAKNLLSSWKCLTTQDFFGLNNWSGQVIFADNLAQDDFVEQAVIFDVTLATDEFWQCFNWSGEFDSTPNIEADKIIKDTEEIITAVEEFTLNNLSQLF